MTAAPTIIFDTRIPNCVIDQFAIRTAPLMKEMLNVLGKPDRVEASKHPASTGHRNNQMHIYDSLGIVLYEHHLTGRCDGLLLTLSNEKKRYHFQPTSIFTGQLLVNGVALPLACTDKEFVAALPLKVRNWIAGNWGYSVDGFSVCFAATGLKARSGRRSKPRRVSEIGIGWPHDPWQTPV